MCAYKLHINGALASVGPGRPEAPVAGGDGTYKRNPYTTLDVSQRVKQGENLLAVGGVHKGGAQVLLQLVVRYDDGAGGLRTLTVGTDSSWLWKEGNSYYNPTAAGLSARVELTVSC